jgi:CRISPR/Cas system CMR subunit Cmr4 (Cas7 group RAMP superfamily)
VVAVRFGIQFHTPFRVAAGRAGDSADTTVDRGNPLPASSLKGVMRSAARDLLRLAPDWVTAVYGEAWQPSPWSWSDATPMRTGPTGEITAPVRVRARIQVADATGTVVEGALALAEEVLAHHAEFTITRAGWLAPRLVAAHETVLIASARAVTAIGGDRRRGLGWVSITPIDPPWPADEPGSTGVVAAHVDALVAALSTLPDLQAAQ